MKLAIIPARGGSKRIPRKNIKPFCGKPMIAWSIEAALASGCIDRVIVSTPGDFPGTERYYTEAFSLPMYPALKDVDQKQTFVALEKALYE